MSLPAPQSICDSRAGNHEFEVQCCQAKNGKYTSKLERNTVSGLYSEESILLTKNYTQGVHFNGGNRANKWSF